MGRGEVSGDVSSGVQDAPHVDVVVGGYVEDEIGEFLERPVPKFWDLQFKCESERPGERVLLKVVYCGFQRIYEIECGVRTGFLAVVGHRGLDVVGREGAEEDLHGLGVGLCLVSE